MNHTASRAGPAPASRSCRSLPRHRTIPTKPVRILVPYPPGGASDVTARILADKLSQEVGHAGVRREQGRA